MEYLGENDLYKAILNNALNSEEVLNVIEGILDGL